MGMRKRMCGDVRAHASMCVGVRVCMMWGCAGTCGRMCVGEAEYGSVGQLRCVGVVEYASVGVLGRFAVRCADA